MFGLGWMELLIIGDVIMLFAGPVGARKVFASIQELKKTKDELTGGSPLERLAKVDRMLTGEAAEESEVADAPTGAGPREEPRPS